jgi:hypothetical protein
MSDKQHRNIDMGQCEWLPLSVVLQGHVGTIARYFDAHPALADDETYEGSGVTAVGELLRDLRKSSYTDRYEMRRLVETLEYTVTAKGYVLARVEVKVRDENDTDTRRKLQAFINDCYQAQRDNDDMMSSYAVNLYAYGEAGALWAYVQNDYYINNDESLNDPEVAVRQALNPYSRPASKVRPRTPYLVLWHGANVVEHPNDQTPIDLFLRRFDLDVLQDEHFCAALWDWRPVPDEVDGLSIYRQYEAFGLIVVERPNMPKLYVWKLSDVFIRVAIELPDREAYRQYTRLGNAAYLVEDAGVDDNGVPMLMVTAVDAHPTYQKSDAEMAYTFADLHGRHPGWLTDFPEVVASFHVHV